MVGTQLGKGFMNLVFIPVYKTRTRKLNIVNTPIIVSIYVQKKQLHIRKYLPSPSSWNPQRMGIKNITVRHTWWLFQQSTSLSPVTNVSITSVCTFRNSYDIRGLVPSAMIFMSEWASEWSLFSGNSVMCQLCHGENKLIFNEMMMRSVLY